MKDARAEYRLERLRATRDEYLALMTPLARQTYEQEVRPAVTNGNPSQLLSDLWSVDYLCKPVSVREFIFSDYFLGQSLADSVYPKIVDDLEELFEANYSEVVLTGSQAWGKTVFANIGILYDIHRLACLKNPAAAFGQIPGSPMAFVNVSVRKQQAMKVFFGGLYGFVNNSPYFLHDFPFRKTVRNEIQFCRGSRTVVRCYPVTANEQSVLGEFIFSAAMDEVNFMDIVAHSRRQRYGHDELFSQAAQVYNRISVRIRGRLNQRGNLPGHLWIISSALYPNDFTQQKQREALDDPHIFARSYAVWDTKPRSTFTCNLDGSLKTFPVETGDLTRRSRILRGDETDVNPARIIQVPVDLRPAFERDLERALRDLAGQSTLSINPFIVRAEMIRSMFVNGTAAGLKHPLNRVDADGRPLDVTLQEPTSEGVQFVPENLHWVTRQKLDNSGRPGEEKVLFDALYYSHVDLSKSRDASGLCVGHVIGTKKVERFDDKTYKTKKEELPIIRIDLMVRIVPPRGGEIDIPRIRGLLYQLRDGFGMQFGLVTFDTFGSQESVKTMKDSGFNCEVFSVDTDSTAYEMLKAALYDERLLIYEMPKLEEELAKLEWTGTKVDHPSVAGSSKDLADCLAAVVCHCEEGWRAGAGSRGMFQLGSVELPELAYDPEDDLDAVRARAAAKVINGQPLTGDEENALIGF